MDFNKFVENYRVLKINKKRVDLEDMIDTINHFQFVKNHQYFYPKGIFLDDYLELYFFCDQHVHVVYVGEESTKIVSRNFKDIFSIELMVRDRYGASLSIKFNDGHVIEFDNEQDTNDHWDKKFKNIIINIYNLLQVK